MEGGGAGEEGVLVVWRGVAGRREGETGPWLGGGGEDGRREEEEEVAARGGGTMKPVVVLGRARRRAAPAPRKKRRRGEDRVMGEGYVSAVCVCAEGGQEEGREEAKKLRIR